MSTDDKEKKPEPELKMVGPGVEDNDSVADVSTITEDQKTDEGKSDERAAQIEDSELSDEQREERRKERHERKQRQREAKNRDKVELEFLRKRNEALERRFSGLEQTVVRQQLDTVETRISNLKAQINVADGVIAKAIESGEGADAVEAQTIKAKLERVLERLEEAKQTRPATRQPVDDDEESDLRQTAAQKPNRQVIKAANSWMEKNSWYDPTRGDVDSAMVGALEDNLYAEGDFDPATPEYWKELDKLIAKKLPHIKKSASHVNGDDEDDEDDEEPAPRKNGGGPRFSSGGRTRSLKPGEVYVSPDRKKAMEEAGVWDDPKLRQRYLKQYAAWDKEHSRRNAN